jgi:ABC-2 type transport system permease protein
LSHLGTLTRIRIQLAMRNKMFFFFSVIMPMGFFFLYAGIFAKGDPNVVRYLMGPALSLSVMGSFWGMSAALVIYREQGILRRFHVTPVSAGEMLASSVLANYSLTLPIVFVEILFARFVFHVRDFGDLLSLLVIVTVGTVAFGAMGLVVASVTNTMQETQIINQLIWLPMIFLSGATVPLPTLPAFVQKIGVFLPATYLVSGLQKAFFLSVAPWKLLVELGSLAFWGAISFFLAAQLFRWEPEAKIPRNAKLWAASTIIPFILLGIWENSHGTLQAQSKAAMQLLNRGNDSREKSPPQPQDKAPDASQQPKQ